MEAGDRGRLTVYAGGSLDAEQSAVNTALTVMLIGFPLLLGVVAVGLIAYGAFCFARARWPKL